VCPFHIPDLSSDGPLILSGRYNGSFPKDLEIKGLLADFSNFVIDMKIQEAKDIPVQRVMLFALPYSQFRFICLVFSPLKLYLKFLERMSKFCLWVLEIYLLLCHLEL